MDNLILWICISILLIIFIGAGVHAYIKYHKYLYVISNRYILFLMILGGIIIILIISALVINYH